MTILIVACLVILILCVLFLAIQIKSQNQKQEDSLVQMMLQKKEEETRSILEQKQIQETFYQLNGQLQTLAKESALSQQSLSWMHEHIQSMNKIMTNTKRRGNWGEYQLESLLKIYAGENPRIFSMQFMLNNHKIADAILHLTRTEKVLCIDSKFPVENFLKIDEDPDSYSKLFRMNMKKHIDDVAAKYITEQTVDQAILFIPSEAIYQYVCGSMDDMLDYALTKHVLLTSPTTLVGVIFTLLASTRDFYRSSHIQEIEKNIVRLQEDIDRLKDRNEKVVRTLETLNNQVGLVTTSTQKISKKMDEIVKGKDVQ